MALVYPVSVFARRIWLLQHFEPFTFDGSNNLSQISYVGRFFFYRSHWFLYVVLCNKLGWSHHCHLQKTDETLSNPSWPDLVSTTPLSALLSPLPAVISAILNGPLSSFYPLLLVSTPLCAVRAVFVDVTCDLRHDKQLQCFKSRFWNVILT